jgi:hypothetical protein
LAYIGVVVIEVVVTDVFREWYEALISDEQELDAYLKEDGWKESTEGGNDP